MQSESQFTRSGVTSLPLPVDRNNPDRKFQVLSLDGGGIKGLFSAALLAELEEHLKVNIVDHFDLITGTSTGGIIAVGLGLGLRPREIVQFYLKDGHHIFPSGIRYKVRHYFRCKFSGDPLVHALQNCFGHKLLGDSTKRLVIPSFNLGRGEVYLFKTRHHARFTHDYKIPAWKVAMATASAPTYLPAFKQVNNIRHIDGGVWANNPTMVGVVEALGVLDQDRRDVSVLSVGTSYSQTAKLDTLDTGGIISWLRRRDLISVPFQGQSHGALGQASILLDNNRVVRIDPVVPAELFALDNVGTADKLVAEAAHAARNFAPEFAKTFRPHIALPFTPVPDASEEVA